jgi:hypothetical protein
MRPAILRNIEGPNYWSSRGPVVFHKAARNFPHGHQDFFQIVMHAHGRLIYPDLITASGSYEQHPYVFARRSCGHNTLAIDDRDLESGDYTMKGDFSPELKFTVSAGKTKTAKGDMASLSRSLFLTREYLADFLLSKASSLILTIGTCTAWADCRFQAMRIFRRAI